MAGLVVAVVVPVGWCLASLWFGPRLGFVDRPDDPSLKIHTRPVVPLGGVGVFAGVHVGLALEGSFDGGLFAGTSMLLALGLADDRWQLSPLLRLAVQIVAAFVLTWAAFPVVARWLLWVLGVVGIIVTVNALNLFDGLDGLAGTGAGIAALGVGWLALTRGHDPVVVFLLAAALAGFLALNLPPAQVFLGDNGAYVVGGFLAYGVLTASPSGSIRALMVVAVPIGIILLDMAVAILRRLRQQRPLFQGDRSHIYDQLRDRGWSVTAVVTAAAAVQVAFSLLARGIEATGRSTGPWLVVLVGAAGLALLALLGFVSGTPQRSSE